MALLGTNAIARLATVSSLDMSNTTSAQTLYTVPTYIEGGSTLSGCAITHILHKGVVTSMTSGQWGFGFDSTAYTDVITAAAHTELTGSTVMLVLEAKAGARIGVAGDVLKTQVSVGQTTATTNTMDVIVFGLLW